MKNSVRTAFLLFGDLIMLVVAFFAMLELAFPGRISQEAFDSHFLPFTYVFCAWLLIFFLFNLYETQSVKPTILNLKKVGLASIVAFAASMVIFYIVPDFGITPKTNLVIFSAIFLVLFMGWRRIFYAIFASYFKRGVVLMTDEGQDKNRVDELANYINTYPQSGFFILGKYSSFSEFWAKAGEKQIDTLIISKNAMVTEKDLERIYRRIGNITDFAYAYEDMLGKIPVDFIDNAWFLHNIRSASRALYEEIGKLANSVLALIALVILSPLLFLIAFFIKLDDLGPVFYTQARVGENGKNFRLYKFRSMMPGADRNGAEWTEKNDPRITRTGKIIRRLHVDEIPQLWNIFRGEMALVGPRPELPSFVAKLEKEIPYYGLRHIIAPGFTGWAQIRFKNARGVAESKEKFDYDLFYIKNRNIFMDLGIIFKTITIIFTHD